MYTMYILNVFYWIIIDAYLMHLYLIINLNYINKIYEKNII